jgi:hypothetical protein
MAPEKFARPAKNSIVSSTKRHKIEKSNQYQAAFNLAASSALLF